MEAGCKRADMEAKRYGAPEVRCRRCLKRGMELRSSGGSLQACRHGGVEVWSSGGAVQACRRGGGTEVWSSGALKVRCRRVDVEV